MNIKQARQISLVDFLERLGFKGKQQGKRYWVHSPFCDENTPSFKVNTNLNLWTDWSGGKKRSGDIIDFGKLYFRTTDTSLVLEKIAQVYSHELIIPKVKIPTKDEIKNEEPEIKIKQVIPIESYALFQYLEERKIPRIIADQYCKEVRYELYGREYYAIGFKNDSGGYALRNAHVKRATMPNNYTFINNGAKDVAVFEGFFDFLSYKTLYHKKAEPLRNYLCYNSAVFFENCVPILQAHERVLSYGQNDETGNNVTKEAKEILKEKFYDRRDFYKGYKDLNLFLVKSKLTERHRLMHKL